MHNAPFIIQHIHLERLRTKVPPWVFCHCVALRDPSSSKIGAPIQGAPCLCAEQALREGPHTCGGPILNDMVKLGDCCAPLRNVRCPMSTSQSEAEEHPRDNTTPCFVLLVLTFLFSLGIFGDSYQQKRGALWTGATLLQYMDFINMHLFLHLFLTMEKETSAGRSHFCPLVLLTSALNACQSTAV